MTETMLLKVVDVSYVGNYSLMCTFNDGIVKLVDLSPLLQYPAYQELKDENAFKRFGLDSTIFWSNGADIAPEYLYEHGVTQTS